MLNISALLLLTIIVILISVLVISYYLHAILSEIKQYNDKQTKITKKAS